MSKYVVVTGFRAESKAITFDLSNSKQDIVYNMRAAKKRNDKETYIRMLRLKGFVAKASREFYTDGSRNISLTMETWKNGPKYVVRENGRFKMVLPR